MRIALAVVAFFLLLGAVVARADPSFVLSQTGAAPGEMVQFSISGTESRASYSLEVGGEGVAAGSVPADTAIAGQFAMPDLGDTTRAVMVEAEITESGETTTRARSLQYRAPSQTSAAPPEPQPAPVVAPASTARSAPESSALSRGRELNRPTSRPTPRKRRPRGSPHLVHKQHAGIRQPPTAVEGHLGDSSVGSKPTIRASAPSPAPRPDGDARSPSSAESRNGPADRRESAAPDATSPLATFLTSPPTPAIFSLASGVGVAAGEPGTPPFAALMIFVLLGVTAMTLASGGVVPGRRRTRPEARRRLRDHSPERTSRQPHERRPVHPERQGGETAPADQMAVLLQGAAASFAPISLDLLDRRATLATRSDRKYFLEANCFERLIGELLPHYLILEIDDARVFPYDSVYFDTPSLLTYRQHLQGRRKRFKCRTRLYAASELCFFEVKLKGGRGETIKHRFQLRPEEHGSLTRPALGFLGRELHQAYGTYPPAALAAALGPALRTFYRRLTLVGRTNPERITFDFGLMFAANDSEYTIQPGRVLVEAKGDAGAGEGYTAAPIASGVLRRLGVRPVQSCSKYCLGVALTHPEMRNNPFRPLIRHHFDPSRHPRPGDLDRPVPVPHSVEGGEESQQVAPVLPIWQEGTA